MRAFLKNHRQSPRKVRLVADLIRGKTLHTAYVLLENTPKRATHQIRKVLDSAVANAIENEGARKEDLVVENVRVDEGKTLHRHQPVSRGRAHPIRKRTSHITVLLGTKTKSTTSGNKQTSK